MDVFLETSLLLSLWADVFWEFILGLDVVLVIAREKKNFTQMMFNTVQITPRNHSLKKQKNTCEKNCITF